MGLPTATNGKDVEVTVTMEGANFIQFDADSMTLSIGAGVTTNAEAGIYSITIKLTEPDDSLTESYQIKLTILEATPAIECAPVEELVCYVELIDDQEVETCEC